MDTSRPQTSSQRAIAALEVPEFMVRRVDGHVLPVLDVSPDSGVVYNGVTKEWAGVLCEDQQINLDEIYAICIPAQNELVAKTQRLCAKRAIACPDVSASTSWTDVEQSILSSCHVLEELSEKDKAVSPGFTGKLKAAFRKLCENAGAGTTLTNLVPTDSYCSILCGGLKVIFKALEETGRYRQEIYNAVENIPYILSDHMALVSLNGQDVELHRRTARLYRSIFQLMEIILSWFLKSSLATGTKMLINHSGFSQRIKDGLDNVKVEAERLARHAVIMSARGQQDLKQQNFSLMYWQQQGMLMQDEHARRFVKDMGEMKELMSRLVVFENLDTFLQSHWQAKEIRDDNKPVPRQPQLPACQVTVTDVSVDEILEDLGYEAALVTNDCDKVLKIRQTPGYDVEDEHITAIQSHPRFRLWLTLNKSTLFFLNAESGHHPALSFETSIVSAEVFRRVVDIARDEFKTAESTIKATTPIAGPTATTTDAVSTSTILIPLAFFCSQHANHRRDVNGVATKLAMSLLLQLLDKYRSIDITLAGIDELDPEDLSSICSVFESLLGHLPARAIVVLIVDGLWFFSEPEERRRQTAEVIRRLVTFHREGVYAATLKFLFASSARTEFVKYLFNEDETLRMPVVSASGDGGE